MNPTLLRLPRIRQMRLPLLCLMLLAYLVPFRGQAQFCPNGSTVAGGNGNGSAPNQLNQPSGVFVDGVGNVYVADNFNNRVQRWAPGATQGTTVAGGNGFGSEPNQLFFAAGVFVDGVGNVYVSDAGNSRVQRWAPGATQGTTVAGGNLGSAASQLNSPEGVFVDGSGNVYVADRDNNRIQRWAPGASQGTTVAGGNGEGSAPNQLNQPYDVFVDGSENVYVADTDNHRIQRWAPGASQGTTLAGGNGRGSAPNQLNSPEGVFVDGSGNVYVADTDNHRIQRWAPGASQGTTVAGGNGRGSAPNQLNNPEGVFVDGSGNVYVSDRNNNRVQRFAPGSSVGITQQPLTSQTACTGATITASVSVSGPVSTYQWYRNNAPVANQTSATLSLPSVTTANSGSYVVVATGSCNSLTSTAFNLTVQQPSVNINPSTTAICAGQSATLIASGATTYRWSSQQTTPSINVTTGGTYSVTGTTTAGCSATASASVTVNPRPTVSLSNDGPITCARPVVTLTASTTSTGGTYRFLGPGANETTASNQIFVVTQGQYSVVYVNAQGCQTFATTTTVESNSDLPSVSISPSSSTLTCTSPTATLMASGTGQSLSFRWSTGQTTPAISVSTAGPYSVTLTSATNGCSGVATATVEQNTSLAPPTLLASATSTNQPISVTASGCGGTVNWSAQGGLGQANGNLYTFTQPGSYTLTASCTLGTCTSPASTPLSLQILPGGLAITGVDMVNCQLTDAAKGEYRVLFNPRYSGTNANPLTFAVVNELSPTTATAPYTLRLYDDNPRITLLANQAGQPEARFVYDWLASCQSGTAPNRPPTSSGIASQTILQGQPYQLELTNYFSDPDGQTLTFQAQGLPAGLILNGSLISGTPTQTGIASVSVTALDPTGSVVNTGFQLTVSPRPTTPTGFTIVGVSAVGCEVVSGGERRVTFNPQYGGLDGSPVSFSVVNELAPTTQAGPYSLRLYTDNPVITLVARQGSTVVQRSYNWLAGCSGSARQGSAEVVEVPLTVTVLGNPVVGETVELEVRGAEGQSLQVRLVDARGRLVSSQQRAAAQAIERLSLPVGGQGAGLLVVQVSTPTQHRTVKVLKAN